MTFYKKHLFFCVNQKEGDKKCCANSQAHDMCAFAKQRIKELNLQGENIRVSSSGCMGRCKTGPALVIYPQGVWYTYESKEDVEEIIQSHVIRDVIVERLLMKDIEAL